MITLIILISIYILSAISWWLLVHYWGDDSTPKWTTIITFIPIFNTVFIFVAIYSGYEDEIDEFFNKVLDPVKFFKTK